MGVHHVSAGGRAPGVQPAGAFGERRLVGDEEGIVQQLLGLGGREVGRRDRGETAADGVLQADPVGGGRPAGLAGTHAGGGRSGRIRGGPAEGGGAGHGKTGPQELAALHRGGIRVTSGVGSRSRISMGIEAGDDPEGWADRRLGRDGAAASGSSGAQGVTNGVKGGVRAGVRTVVMGGWAPSRTALLAVAGVVALNAFVNIMTILDDAHRRGVAMPAWLPVTLEGTSAVAAMIAGVAIYQALRLAPPERGPLWRTLLVHAGGTLVFSGAHVGLMTLFRMAAFRAIGQTYDFSIS